MNIIECVHPKRYDCENCLFHKERCSGPPGFAKHCTFIDDSTKNYTVLLYSNGDIESVKNKRARKK